MTASFSLGELSELFAALGSQLAVEDEPSAVFARIVDAAARYVPGAEHAGITVGRDPASMSTVAATDEVVRRTDDIQYELRSGPCVDAVVQDTRFTIADLRSDPRWPAFGPRAAGTTGIVSMLSLRLFTEADRGLIAGLNMYAHSPAAFDQTSESIALLLATHGALAAARASAEQKAQNLMVALRTSREIGVAMGIIMAYAKVDRDQAFDLLRIASQHTHRKLSDIATQIADTGELPPLPTTRPRPAHPPRPAAGGERH